MRAREFAGAYALQCTSAVALHREPHCAGTCYIAVPIACNPVAAGAMGRKFATQSDRCCIYERARAAHSVVHCAVLHATHCAV